MPDLKSPTTRRGGQPKPIAHDEYRGAKQHRRRGERPCTGCAAAEAAYQRDRKPVGYLTEEQWQAKVAHRVAMGGSR